jgi:hypothetical protein
MANNDIATQNSFNSGLQRYSSIKGSDLNTRKAIFAAMSDAKTLNEHLNETIYLRHVIIQPVTTEDEKGNPQEFLRTVLISEDGTAYASGSQGIILALQSMFDVFGEPNEWAEPVAIKVVEERGNRGYRYMTIKPADEVES